MVAFCHRSLALGILTIVSAYSVSFIAYLAIATNWQMIRINGLLYGTAPKVIVLSLPYELVVSFC